MEKKNSGPVAQNLDLSDYESMIRQVKLPLRTVTASTGTRVEDSSYLLARLAPKNQRPARTSPNEDTRLL